jgi:hypothetical protein
MKSSLEFDTYVEGSGHLLITGYTSDPLANSVGKDDITPFLLRSLKGIVSRDREWVHLVPIERSEEVGAATAHL